jgi:hypothetical protein
MAKDHRKHDGESVLFTAEFCNIFGGCEHCHGVASAEQLRSCSKPGFIPVEIADDQAVFCTHWCHQEMQTV